MKKYQFKSEAALKDFVEGIDPKKYKIVEGNVVEMASFDESEMEYMEYAMEELKYEVKYLRSELNYVYSSFAEHCQKGHLPPVIGAGKMQKALDALGISDDYAVEKKFIYANKHGDFEVDLPSLNKNEEK